MTLNFGLMRTVATIAALAALCGQAANAQTGVQGNIIATALNATKNTAITVTVLSGAVQNLPSITDGAINTFPTPVRITTTWTLTRGKPGNISLVAYFMDPAQALTNGTRSLPTSTVQGRVATGTPTTFTNFTQSGIGAAGTAGASLQLWTQRYNASFGNDGTRTDDLELRLDLTSQAALAAGTYAGTMYIRAVTY